MGTQQKKKKRREEEVGGTGVIINDTNYTPPSIGIEVPV
jgi:hypothetical protein